MTNLRHSFKAATYHKRMTVTLFILFSIFLLALSFLSQLIETQKFNLSFLLGKWKQLKGLVPNFDTNLNTRLLASNDFTLQFYENLRITVLILSFVLFFFLSLHATKSRKEEIYSLNYIGIKRKKILPRFLLELLFPVILSLPIIFCVLLLFHNQLLNQSVKVNQQVLRHYFESEQVVRKKRESALLEVKKPQEQIVVATNTNKENTLIPYNKTSILDVNIAQNSSTHIFMTLFVNFILLYANMIIAYIAGFYCYTTFGFRRRRLIG